MADSHVRRLDLDRGELSVWPGSMEMEVGECSSLMCSVGLSALGATEPRLDVARPQPPRRPAIQPTVRRPWFKVGLDRICDPRYLIIPARRGYDVWTSSLSSPDLRQPAVLTEIFRSMISPSEFRDLVSGKSRGAGARLLRGVLRTAEVPYTWAVRWRNRRYDCSAGTVHRVSVPVISVGNLTLGGTGKTPLVKWIAGALMDRGVRVAVVSRGYGAARGEANDEARELARALPGVPHVQDPDRVRGARQAIAKHGAELILLDDGFQHRRLARELDVVLLDALEPFGFGHVFPRGMLREPPEGLARAAIVCLSRADAVSEERRDAIRRQVAQYAPGAKWCEIAHTPSTLVNAQGQTRSLELLANRRVAAFCGIGNPDGFRHTMATTGSEVVAWREFPDHHAFGSSDLAELDELARTAQAELLVCTQKDLVKIGAEVLGQVPLWALAIEMGFLKGQCNLERLLFDVLARKDDRRS